MSEAVLKFAKPKLVKKERRIAYFSMEIGLDSNIRTYSGGLGILAGDTIRSAADLNVPMVAVSLVYKKGYFFQNIDGDGVQTEEPNEWNPREYMELLDKRVLVKIEGRNVEIQAWAYKVEGTGGYTVPVIYLDTDVPENSDYDRSLSYHLYGGDDKYRLAQEAVLGIGGIRMLKALGYDRIKRYHMNEGHAALLTLELLNETKKEEDGNIWDVDGVRQMCVFTTHTPIPAGHDKFSYDLVRDVLGEPVPFDFLKEFGGKDHLNMTLLALNLSFYLNGVAKEHGKVSREMFPGYHIDSITNGVHSATWVCDCFKELFDKYMPGWRNDSFSLRYALSLPEDEVWSIHQRAKDDLINRINERRPTGLENNVFTIGFARRATTYKRADLIFYNKDRLTEISKKAGKFQLIFAGKAHPKDLPGKELIRKIIITAREIKNEVNVVYLENYDMATAKLLVSGVDLWLNTPRKPREASGTSGMKAAHNGIPSFSILDGWWIEGCLEGLTGWAIDSATDAESDDSKDAESLYKKLSEVVIPKFYKDRSGWVQMMRRCIAINASFFNTNRMVQQYVLNAYL